MMSRCEELLLGAGEECTDNPFPQVAEGLPIGLTLGMTFFGGSLGKLGQRFESSIVLVDFLTTVGLRAAESEEYDALATLLLEFVFREEAKAGVEDEPCNFAGGGTWEVPHAFLFFFAFVVVGSGL